MSDLVPIIILAAVFIAIAVRQIGRFRLGIWQVMLAGAAAMLLSLQISPAAAFGYIDFNVILFLIGAFIIGRALEESGYLDHLEYVLFRRAKGVSDLALLILFGFGFASAFLMNDTLAIIGTPLVIGISRRHYLDPKMMMFALAFAITTGSVMSPIGNPQNLLVATSGISNPFAEFFRYLFLPTIANLLVAYLVLRLFYPREFGKRLELGRRMPLKDKKLAALAKISLALFLLLIAAQVFTSAFDIGIALPLSGISVVAALPVLIFSKNRARLVRRIDWSTIAFFISLFVVMGAVWQSGFFQGAVSGSGIGFGSISAVIPFSIIVSQFISNVPLAILYLKLLSASPLSVISLMALAAGSTIAGNLTILGAASNVIIIQKAERNYGQTISFVEFVRIGAPLTILNALVYLAFLSAGL